MEEIRSPKIVQEGKEKQDISGDAAQIYEAETGNIA